MPPPHYPGPSALGKSTLNGETYNATKAYKCLNLSVIHVGQILSALRPAYASLLHRFEKEIPKQEAENEERHKLKLLLLEEKHKAQLENNNVLRLKRKK